MTHTPQDGDEPTYGRVTSRAAREATGRGWREWVEVLDTAGARNWDHKEVVAFLEREHPQASPWWRQSIAVAYEKARGSRVLGETADAGFEVGVQRSLAVGRDEVWEILVARPDLWLGEGAEVDLERGGPYVVRDAADDGGAVSARGDVRVVRPGHRLRMTWQPEGWASPATLQLTLSVAASGRTTLGVHLEKLPDAQAREAMREHWRGVLDRVVRAVG